MKAIFEAFEAIEATFKVLFDAVGRWGRRIDWQLNCEPGLVLFAVLLAGLLEATSPRLQAQYEILPAPSVQSTRITHLAGTIIQVEPEGIVLQGKEGEEGSSQPLTITFTPETLYVDEAGSPLPRQSIQTGTPVTVYYQREGNRLVALRVMVRKTSPP